MLYAAILSCMPWSYIGGTLSRACVEWYFLERLVYTHFTFSFPRWSYQSEESHQGSCFLLVSARLLLESLSGDHAEHHLVLCTLITLQVSLGGETIPTFPEQEAVGIAQPRVPCSLSYDRHSSGLFV